MVHKQISLRTIIFVLLASLMCITSLGATVILWMNHRTGVQLASLVDANVAAMNVARKLKTSLIMQKGLLTTFFVEGDPEWLKQLDDYRQAFEDGLKKAREFSYGDRQHEILNDMESRSIRYNYARDQVIGLYKSGDKDGGLRLHREIRPQFYALLELCERYGGLHEQGLSQSRAMIDQQIRSINTFALLAIFGSVIFGSLLVYILIRRVLGPIRALVMGGAETAQWSSGEADEVKALSRRVHSLMEDVDQTQTQLQLSREHLLQSEKLAMVGRLAAGVAHSIRNPLTSVKMRLFSMERSLELQATEKEDFDVISEEIRHIDTIVRNFLEFSRRPKLKIQSISPSDVVDMAIQLLRHRIESYGVEVELYRQRKLPAIEADPEQLKEVVVNLVVNACESMSDGGKIILWEEEGVTEPLGRVVVIRVTDNGPGIPDTILDKVFEPFFSTKEEGTGLGLSIATRIIEDHRGWLHLKSREGKGTTFTITLPCKGDGAWLRS